MTRKPVKGGAPDESKRTLLPVLIGLATLAVAAVGLYLEDRHHKDWIYIIQEMWIEAQNKKGAAPANGPACPNQEEKGNPILRTKMILSIRSPLSPTQ
jgi:hypothetical protein